MKNSKNTAYRVCMCIMLSALMIIGALSYFSLPTFAEDHAGTATPEQELDSGSEILALDKTQPSQLDSYPDDVYGADTSAENPDNNTPFLLSEQNELAFIAGDNGSTTMYRFDNFDLDLKENQSTSGNLAWVNGINVSNADENSNMPDNKLEIYNNIGCIQSVGLDADGSGRKGYIASVGYFGSSLTLVIQNASTGAVKTYTVGAVEGAFGAPYWLRDNCVAITAGDYDGDGKDSVIIYYCGDGSNNLRLIEYYPTATGWSNRTVMNLSSVVVNTNWQSDNDYRFKPVVSLATGDFNGDGTDQLAYSAGFYNTSNSKADGYQNFECDNLEQFATCVGIYNSSGSSWTSAAGPIWMYDQASDFTQSGDYRTYNLTIMHGGVIAAGDVNNDGIDEIVAAGYMSLDSNDNSTSCARAIRNKTTGELVKVSGVCNWSDNLVSSVISYKNKKYTRNDLQPFSMSQAQHYTFAKFDRENEWGFVKLAMACGTTNGNNVREDVFISGIIYDYSSLSPVVKYSPNFIGSNDMSKTTGGDKAESAENWIRNVSVGNFNGNDAGREQFVYTLWQKYRNAEKYSANVGVITGVEFEDTKTGGVVTSYGQPKYYACNMNVTDMTNGNAPIHGSDVKATQVLYGASSGTVINAVPVAVDIDNDGVLGRFSKSGYVYTDPEVLAVLEAGPYYDEINEAGGYEDPCETLYSIAVGYGTGTSRSDNVSFEAGFAGEAELGSVKTSLELGYAMDWSHAYESSYTVTRTKTVKASSKDIVVVNRIPQLVYTYDLYDAANNTWIENGYNVKVPLTPRYFSLSIDDYNEFVDEYNAIVGANSDYALVKIIDGVDLPEDHTGNPDKYWTSWSQAGSGAQNLSEGDYDLSFASGSMGCEYEDDAEETESEETSHGLHYGLTMQYGIDATVAEFWAGGYVNLDYSHSTGHSTTKVNTSASGGQVQNIDADSVEGLSATEVKNSYGFTWNFGKWTRKLVKDPNSKAVVPFYGYVVFGDNGAPAKRRALPPQLDDINSAVTVGYEAFGDTKAISGLASVLTVIKESGNDKITYDASSRSIKVAAGLEPGTYKATFRISNGLENAQGKAFSYDTRFKYILTVVEDYANNWTGSGSENDPYVITNTEGWNDLADFVAAGVNTEEVYFTLGDDISVTESVGTSATPFAGVFDGDGHTLSFNQTATGQNCAPFAVTDNAVFKNLHTEGVIETGYKFAGGLVGTAGGNTTVTNCRSSMIINSNVNGDGTHGGFVGRGNVIYEGCVFDGGITGGSTTSCGGFQGWDYGQSKCVNCLLNAEEITTNNTTGTFIRNSSDLTNCYYMQALGKGSDTGKQAHTISADEGISIRFGEGTEYYVSGITAHDAGIEYNGIFFAGEGDQVSLTLPDPSARLKEYAVSEGMITGSGTDYVLDMPDSDVLIFMIDTDDPSINDVTEKIDGLDGVINELAELQYQLTNGGLSEEELNEVNTSLYRIEERLEGVRRDVSDLTDVQKSRLSEDQLAALADAEQQLGEVMTIADSVGKTEDEIAEMQSENQSKADEVINLISWLPDPAGLDPAVDETGYEIAMEQIRAAENAYASLKPQEKALVSNVDSLIATAQAARQKRNSYTPVVEYTVTFVDGQGNTLNTESVEKGKAATAPENPTREGYTFDGWNKDFSNITSDLTVTAKWKKNTTPPAESFTVTFVDGQGKTLKTQTVEKGKAATAPAEPTRDGYTFDGWDKDFSNVTSNLTVTAKWKENTTPPQPTETFTVTFVDGQGKTLKTQTVEKGKAATAPADPTRDGYTFDGWDKDFSNVTSNLTVTAKWKENTTPPAPDQPVSIENAEVVLSATDFTYNGKVHKPTIKTIGARTLKSGADYTVKWSNASSKNVGAYTVTINGTGNYTGTTKATYKINPKGTKLSKLVKGKRSVTVKWKKQSAKMATKRITGYQLQLATDKKFTKNVKKVTVKGYKKASKKVSKLKGGKKYYVRIRTYMTVNGEKCYSPWSKVKTVTTKK